MRPGAQTTEESAVVFRDPLWTAQTVPGYDVPRWFVLRARRHAERITGLDDTEAATFGRRARDLVAAVTEATGAPRPTRSSSARTARTSTP
ncbi:hypothetical protein ABZ203_00650 [Streptomyces albidoflavus]|uniref:hypothetical protein n=1 Tax=Streptomyces albidoflavus TaxID=1886 RepID=UPI0033B004AC